MQENELRQRGHVLRRIAHAGFVGADRSGEIALTVERDAELILDLHARGRQARRFAIGDERRGFAIRFEQDVAEHEMCVRPRRRELHGTARTRFGAFDMPDGEKRGGLIEPRACVVGFLHDGFRETFRGAVVIAACVEQAAEIVERGGILRRQRQRAAQRLFGFVEAAGGGVHAGHVA